MSDMQSKIAALLERISYKDSETQAAKMREFFRENFDADRPPHDVSARDLLNIRGHAIDYWTKLSSNETINSEPLKGNPELIMVYCWFLASYSFLKGKDLMFYDVRIGDDDDDKKKSR